MAKQLTSMSAKVVAITGGARGIGRATAAALLAQGARVAIGDLDGELTRRVAAELGDGVLGLPLDVTSRDSFDGFLARVERELGALDVLVNNAGIAPIGDFARESDAVTQRLLEVNLGGTALGCKLALARMLPRAAGQIVNVSSALGRTPAPEAASYCATKYGIVGLSEALQAELEGSGVQLHLILPGLVDTDMAAGVRSLRGVRTQRPDDVAEAIVEMLRSGRPEVYVPRALGRLIRLRPVTPRAVVRWVERAVGAGRLYTRVDALERAAYEARIVPPAGLDPADRAATVASAAASAADALRAGDDVHE